MSYDGVESTFLDQTVNIPPMIAFHGKADNVHYIGKYKSKFAYSGYMPYSPIYPDLNSTNFCTLNGQTYTLDGDETTYDLITEGSYGMYNILKSLGKEVELYADCNMKHGIQAPARDNFGITATSNFDVLQYIVQRASTFFQAVLSGSAGSLNRDLFVDCENFRIKCDTPQSLADNPSTTTCPNATCLQGIDF